MTSQNVLKLPNSAPSYIRVRRYGRQWCVGSRLTRAADQSRPGWVAILSRTAAVEFATWTGLRMQRPVRLPEPRP